MYLLGVQFAFGVCLLVVGIVTLTLHAYHDPVELEFDAASQRALR